jgi:hypothetical protein
MGRVVLADPKGATKPGRRLEVRLVQGSAELASALTDEGGAFTLAPPAGAKGEASLRFRLANPRWSVEGSDGPYEWEMGRVKLPLEGPADLGTVVPQPGGESAKLAFIQLQLLSAMDFFDREGVKLDWWNRQVRVLYPGTGDFFEPWSFTVNLTRPETWDVNLHELGHAVMALGTRSEGGGGAHKIDECYNAGLAWSEGWATFFAGAVSLSPDDPDARFEFLVPRRAPIRIENVPEDVCRGDKSEWRVAAALWDLYDRHVDGGDRVSIPFARLWAALEGKRMTGFSDAWGWIAAMLSPAEQGSAAEALAYNTVIAARRQAPAALPAPKPLSVPFPLP